MTRCLTELQIEALVLTSLSNSQTTLPDHIDTCSACKAHFTAFQVYYTNAEEIFSTIDVHARLAVIDRILEGKNRNLYVFHSIHKVQSESFVRPYQKTLAADGEISTPKPKVQNIGVFSSTDDRLMVRVLQETDMSYSLFLLSDTPELYKNVLVRIVGNDTEYVSDSNGSIHLSQDGIPDPDELGIEVRTTNETYDLKTIFPRHGELIGEGEISLEPGSKRRIKMEISAQDSNYTLKVTLLELDKGAGTTDVKVMVVKDDSQAEVVQSVSGVALFQEIKDPSNLQVKIFA